MATDNKEESFIQLIGESARYESAGIVWKMIAEERRAQSPELAKIVEQISEHCLALGVLFNRFAEIERGETISVEVPNGACAN